MRVGARARHLDRLAGRAARTQPSRRLGPAARARAPSRSTDTTGTNVSGKSDELRAVRRRLGGEPRELVDRRLAVEDDRLGLDARDADGVVHALRAYAPTQRVERGAQRRDERGAARPRPASAASTAREPTTTPSTSSAAARACSGVEMPKPA